MVVCLSVFFTHQQLTFSLSLFPILIATAVSVLDCMRGEEKQKRKEKGKREREKGRIKKKGRRKGRKGRSIYIQKYY